MRNLGLDILRMIAVLLVLGRHLSIPKSGIHPLVESTLTVWQRGGWVGVDLFFVLSGFLVSGLLFKEQQKRGAVSVRHFLIRRGFKIYPAFWALLLFSIPMKLFLGNEPITGRAILGEIFFVQNYLGGLWNHTWSLAVEEHFYILFAFVASFLVMRWPNRNFSAIPLLFGIVAAACLGLRIGTVAFESSFQFWNVIYPTHLRIDSLFFGVLLSYCAHYHGLLKCIGKGRAALLLLTGVCFLTPPFIVPIEGAPRLCIYGVTLCYAGAGMLVLAASKLEGSQSRVLQGMGTLGAASYSIYLWHIPVSRIADRLFGSASGRPFWLYFFFYLGGSIIVGQLLGRLVEIPFLRLRERFYPSFSRGAPEPGVETSLDGEGKDPVLASRLGASSP